MIDWRPADADAIADRLAGVLTRSDAVVAMPGGRTPLPILKVLAARDVSGTVWPTDDRIVPPDHPASNVGMLSRALPELNVIPLHEGARAPRFDLVWIGKGADGHVASIFPNAMDELLAGRDVVRTRPEPLPPEAPFERLALTIASLADTDAAILVIAGADKKRVLDAALAGQTDLPISRFVAKLSAPLTIYWNEA